MTAPGTPPLHALRVVDLSSGIAGAYCTKLLADSGADVLKVEAPDGNPLRRWSASGAPIAAADDGALFCHLAASTRATVVDPTDAGALAGLDALLAEGDVVVWSPESALAALPDMQPRAIVARHPHLVVTAITVVGLDADSSDEPSTEFTLQAWSGAIIGLGRGTPDREPVHVGGQIGAWVTGVWAAIGTLAACRRGDGEGDVVDVSMLETLAMCLTYFPVTFNDQLGYPMRRKRMVPTPGVAMASDGLVGLGCGTGQQWLDVCVMVGHPEWMEDRSLFLERAALAPTIDAWVAERTVDEVRDLASAFRIPNAPIVDGANATTIDHFVERGTFTTNPRDGAVNPGPPFRLSTVPPLPRRPAPRLGEHAAAFADQRAPRPARVGSADLPFAGVRVLDMTAFWAGPLAGHVLALLGAEVIHVESAKRPDGVRLVGGVPQSTEQFWERGPIFAALNTNKKSLTIDFADPRGVELVRGVAATCDVVIENYTPRVDNAGLGYDALREANPDLVMVRMPGFGLDGPWRDLAAFAFVIEDASGLTWLTGHPDLLPIEPYCVGDPTAGLHAVVATLLALEHRDRTGASCLVEAAMVDAALNVTAEQVIEHSAYGTVLTRTGNRGPCAAPQNLYQAAAPADGGRDDAWVAVAVASDEQWTALRNALGDPTWAADPALSTDAGRRAAHDEIDTYLAAWCRKRQADDIVEALRTARVPVGKVIQPHEQPTVAALASRGFFEEVDHPVAGTARYSTLPMRFARGPERMHRRHAPLLGEHNTELLTELGLDPEQIAALEAAGIIGTTLIA